MPKRIIKRYLPHHDTIRRHRHLQVFGERLHDPNLWHLNRRSVSGAFAVGLFTAFVPLPFQMVLAAAAAITIRVNLTVSVVLVWVTNPLTMPAIFYAAYRLGAWMLGERERSVHFEPTFDWLLHGMGGVWPPLLLGCFVLGTLSGAAGYGLIRLLWRMRLVRQHQRKKEARAVREAARREEG